MRFLPESCYVVKLFEIYEENDRIILIMELMEGRSLQDQIKNHEILTNLRFTTFSFKF